MLGDEAGAGGGAQGFVDGRVAQEAQRRGSDSRVGHEHGIEEDRGWGVQPDRLGAVAVSAVVD